MPAVDKRFDESPPDQLFVDTDIAIAYLTRTQPHHARCVAFFQRLAQAGLTTLYLSALAWVEFLHVITRERFRLSLSPEMQQRLRIDRWSEVQIRQAYVQELLGAFDELLSQFAWIEIDLTPDIRQAAAQHVALYNMDGQHAVHLASAMYAGVHDFASLDARFRRVDDLRLWNDLIHSVPRA